MGKINKVDYFCGAFLSYLITNKAEPTLFDAGERSKVINFTLRDKDYNVYLKYVSTSKNSRHSGKEYTLWNINFSDAENEYINTKFEDPDRENLVVLVCGSEDFKETSLAIITLEQALKCLGDDVQNNQRRISVKHQKHSKYLYCYGTALADTNAMQILYNYDEYFGFNDN